MFGNNPIRKPLQGDGSMLDVQEVFPTLQGEGPLVGTPSVFIRLGGCNLQCAFCDTEFESYTALALQSLLEKVQAMALNQAGQRVRKLVVITGGEPFRQPIGALCDALLEDGFAVQIETNGTLYRPVDKRVQVVVSPKAGKQGYAPIRPDVLAHAIAVKFIVARGQPDYSNIAEVGQAEHGIAVYVQPMDEQDVEKNANNLAYAMELCERYGCRLSQQMHKLWGIA